MTDHNEQPSDNPRSLDWSEVAPNVDILKPGDIVSGFQDPHDIDLLFNNIGESLRGSRTAEPFSPPRMTQGSGGRQIYHGWYSGARLPSDALRPPNFHGKIQNIEALVTGTEEPSENAFPRTSLVVIADMASTGRGVVGRIMTHCSIGIHAPQSVGPRFITVRYRKLGASTANAAAEILRKQSETTATRLASIALRQVIYAGLPGSGRRQ